MQLLLGEGNLALNPYAWAYPHEIPWKGALVWLSVTQTVDAGCTAALGRDKAPATTHKGCCTSVLTGGGPTQGTATLGWDKVLITIPKGFCTTVLTG